MTRVLQVAVLIVLFGAAAFLFAGAWAILHITPMARAAAYNVSLTAYNANQVMTTANDTFAALNAPCHDFQGDYICGPIPQLAQTEKNVGILAAQSVLQVRQSATLVNTASQSLKDTSQAVKGTADAATNLLASAARTTDQLPADLNRIIADFDATQGPIAAIGQDAADFDALLRDQAIHQTLSAAAATLGNANGILADGRKVADKAAADFLKPVPWWKQPLAKGGELIDITAAIARHAP